ncbi:MAG: glycosyltransferase family 2 protein [Gammaproteobacteria bacterium]|nr:glycosyltransferase family 2 protein [Gammaproteobacteria bacterium]
MNISVILTTYNSPEWLEKVLWGFQLQQDRDFEIIVADDGSDESTSQLLDRIQFNTDLTIQHVWQEDDGFQKCRILNKAILRSRGDYIVMTDGDCIPRSDFVATHRRFARPGYYLSGGYFKLPMDISKSVSFEDIRSGKVFSSEWLRKQGLDKGKNTLKLDANGIGSTLLNHLTPTKRTWNGHNASVHRTHAIRVNGFDERMRYGGQDCEFGERLRNAGLKARQIRYSAICLHLDHARPYRCQESLERNRSIREHTRRFRVVETPFGIRRLDVDTAQTPELVSEGA